MMSRLSSLRIWLQIVVLGLMLKVLSSFPTTTFRKCTAVSRRQLSSNAIQSQFYDTILDNVGLLEEQELQIARVSVDAANKAGKVLLEGLGSIDLTSGIESKIGSRDIVTRVDKEAQQIIQETISKAFPHHKFLGEEDVPPGIEASRAAIEKLKDEEHLWIVDPVDGTTNFAHGMPLSGVIIAYASRGVVQHGLIYDPFYKELFTAWKGKGAYLNGKRIRCCSTSALSSSVVMTGSPPNFQALNACLRATNLLSPLVRTMRMLGSAAVMLSYVAVGRATAYVEADLNAWDLAAGSLLINEAGGRVTDVWGKDYLLTTRNLVATNGVIHEEMLAKLQEARMWLE